MLERAALAALNHVLADAAWARDRLRPFAGQHAVVEAGPLVRFVFAVDGAGWLVPSESPGEPAVVVALPADAPLRYLVDPGSVFAAARLSGSADFAENLAFVFRNLRWDIEGDLAKKVGDIAAHRLVRGGKALAAWQKDAVGRGLANVAEFATEEHGLLARKDELSGFYTAVDKLRDDLARLEKRLARLA